MRRGGKKLSHIFKRFYTIFKRFISIFERFYTVFKRFRTFSNIFERFLHELARLVLSHFTQTPHLKLSPSKVWQD
jgi:hypothetical protein